MSERGSCYEGEDWIGSKQTREAAMHIQLGELVQIPGIWEKRFKKFVNIVVAIVVVGVLLGAMLRFNDVAKIVAEVIDSPPVLSLSADD